MCADLCYFRTLGSTSCKSGLNWNCYELHTKRTNKSLSSDLLTSRKIIPQNIVKRIIHFSTYKSSTPTVTQLHREEWIE